MKMAIDGEVCADLEGDAAIGCLYSEDDERLACFAGDDMDAESIMLIAMPQTNYGQGLRSLEVDNVVLAALLVRLVIS